MPDYLFKLAKTQPEISAYFDLRHKIFVEEQEIFKRNDVDAIDEIAYPIIAVEPDATSLEVLGVVRNFVLTERHLAIFDFCCEVSSNINQQFAFKRAK